MKKILAVLTAVLLVFSTAAALAEGAAKEEVVYGILNPDGSVQQITIVNILTGGGTLTDYGDYTQLQNMTDAQPLTQDGDVITITTDAQRFYYMGTPQNAALPWVIAITYTLDGKTVSAAELAGQSGKLALHLSVTPNPAANEAFYQSYALQIAVTLDTTLCTGITAENATMAEAAGSKQLTLLALPGQGVEETITANVTDFTMDPITLSGIRMQLALAFDTAALKEQLAPLTDAIASLDSGAGDLQTGAAQLAEGFTQYTSGVQALLDGLAALPDGVSQLASGAGDLQTGAEALTAQNDTLLAAALALQQNTFDTVNQQLSGQGLPTLTPENYTQVLGDTAALDTLYAQLDGMVQFVQGLQSYTGGVTQLAQGAAGLKTGADTLTNSLSTLPDSTTALTSAATDLQTGLTELTGGLTTYKDGTATLATQTSNLAGDMDAQVQSAVSGLLGSDVPVTSFVSAKNTNVAAVQFVLKTPAITLPEAEAAPAAEAQPETFWQKLTGLFGL